MQTNINGVKYKKIYIRKKPTDDYVLYKKAYVDGVQTYSAGNPVTYYVDSSTIYTEEVEFETSCLSPKTFTPTKTGWTFVGWREDKTASGTVLTSKVMGDSPIVLYAVFSQNITVTYYNGSTTASSTKGTKYYNNGNAVNPSFTLAQASKSGWSVRGWSTGTAGNSGITYNNNTAFTRDSNVTLYGMYQQTITVTYYNNSTSASSTTGTRYWNSGKNVYTNPSFALTQAASSGWTPRGWSTTNAGNAGITYNSGATFTRDSNVTLYGLYQRTITVTYYNNSTSASTTTGTQYWAPAGYINPSFKLAQATKSGWTPRGWSTSNAGNGGVTYNNNTEFTRSSNVTLYGMYYSTIYLYTVAQGKKTTNNGTVYWAPAGTINASFTVGNPSISGATFKGWSKSASSTTVSYNSISGLSLSASTTLYAVYSYANATLNSAQIERLNTTPYLTIDGTKYSSISVTISYCAWYDLDDDLTLSIGVYNGSSLVSSVKLREIEVISDDYSEEVENLPCSYQKQATVSLNLSNASGLSLKPIPSRSNAYWEIFITTVTAVGRTVVG